MLNNLLFTEYLTDNERNQCFHDAVDNLPAEDKELIKALALEMVESVKAKRPRQAFSERNALEILAAIGLNLIQHGGMVKHDQ